MLMLNCSVVEPVARSEGSMSPEGVGGRVWVGGYGWEGVGGRVWWESVGRRVWVGSVGGWVWVGECGGRVWVGGCGWGNVGGPRIYWSFSKVSKNVQVIFKDIQEFTRFVLQCLVNTWRLLTDETAQRCLGSDEPLFLCLALPLRGPHHPVTVKYPLKHLPILKDKPAASMLPVAMPTATVHSTTARKYKTWYTCIRAAKF